MNLTNFRKRLVAYQNDRRFVLQTLRANQTSLPEYWVASRRMFTSPIFLIVMAFIPLSVWSGFTGLPFKQQSVSINVWIMTIGMVVYGYGVYILAGRWVFEAVARNIPVVWVYVALYMVAHVVFHLIFGPLTYDPDFWYGLGRFGRTVVGGVVLTAVHATYQTGLVRHEYGRNPDLIPVYWPLSAKNIKQITIFSIGSFGKLRWMSAENKGTLLVTDTGEHSVRRSLQEMVSLIDPDLGFHCHRSLWVARAEIENLVYINGNPHIEIDGGKVFPISRTSVAPIRAHLARNG